MSYKTVMCKINRYKEWYLRPLWTYIRFYKRFYKFLRDHIYYENNVIMRITNENGMLTQ